MSFHAGEIAVQTSAGVREEAEGLGQIIGYSISPAAQALLATQHFAVTSTVDEHDRVWASLLVGEPGFVQIINPNTVQIQALPVVGDPLFQNLLVHPQIGILVIDLANRRRLRLNGNAQLQNKSETPTGETQSGIIIQLQEVFFNCPKYIQTRHLTTTSQASIKSLVALTKPSLSPTQHQWVGTADTFFIASFYGDTGADASHRGGFPGFVQVVNSNQLIFPDYAGNNMFQTLGNLTVNPHSGLLFVDFEQGHTLQLTGTAKVLWDDPRSQQFPGAQRLVEFTIAQVLETRNAIPFRWQFGEYSPANPRLT